MCIGIPMRVVQVADGRTWCESRGRRQQIDTMLIGDSPVGCWVLVFQGCARRLMSDDEAAQTNDALDALEAVRNGETNLDGYFADLTGGHGSTRTTAEESD